MSNGSVTRYWNEVDGTTYYKTWNGGNNRQTENSYTMESLWTQNLYTERRYISTGAIANKGYGGYTTRHDLPVYSSNNMLQLLSKLSSEIRGHNFNAGVFGGTLHQTLGTLTGSATALFGGFRALRHGDVESAMRSFARTISGDKLLGQNAGSVFGWRRAKKLDGSEMAATLLAYRYGWEPLIKDVYEAAKYLEQQTQTRQMRIRIRGPVQTSWLNDPVAGASYSYVTRKTVKCELRVVYTEVLTKARSLGLTNPATIAWELIP